MQRKCAYADFSRIQCGDELYVFAFVRLQFRLGNYPYGWHFLIILYEADEAIAKQERQLECVVESIHHILGIDDQLVVRYRFVIIVLIQLCSST